MTPTRPVQPLESDEDETALVARFARRIRAVASRRVHPDSVDDVVQEVLRAVIEAVREQRVKHPERLPAFVYGVTRNVISNWARAEARARRAGEIAGVGAVPGAGELQAAAAETSNPLRLLLSEEERTAVARFLGELREEDREILRLAYYRGLTPKEVAEELDIAPHVARQRLWRARERFKRTWQGLEQKRQGPDAM